MRCFTTRLRRRSHRWRHGAGLVAGQRAAENYLFARQNTVSGPKGSGGRGLLPHFIKQPVVKPANSAEDEEDRNFTIFDKAQGRMNTFLRRTRAANRRGRKADDLLFFSSTWKHTLLGIGGLSGNVGWQWLAPLVWYSVGVV